MDAAWSRLRWRRLGAWMWPAFVVATVADAVIGALLPWSGDHGQLYSAFVVALVLNLLGIVVLGWPAAVALRRVRRDMPTIIARDFTGTGVVVAITLMLLAAGLVNRSSVLSDRRAMADAIVRAQAYIGDRAPDEFRRNLAYVDMLTIQAGSLYRACVASRDGRRTYCVVVDTTKPFARSVQFSGYESNQSLSQGVN